MFTTTTLWQVSNFVVRKISADKKERSDNNDTVEPRFTDSFVGPDENLIRFLLN